MGFLRRVFASRSAPPIPDEWVIVDLETTGLYPRTDRIVEIGLVRVTADGRELDAWTTVVNPERDTGPVQIHGLSARDVSGAPRFRDIAPDLLGHLREARLAAHNARFETSFIGAEFGRLGVDWGPPQFFCTMSVPASLGVVHSRALVACCSELGIPLEHHHALSDARAAAAVLVATLERGRPLPVLPAPAPDWPLPVPPGTTYPRGTPRPGRDNRLPELAARVGVPIGVEIAHDIAVAYLGLLDLILEDRRVTGDEVLALAHHASEWGIDTVTAGQLHSAYLDELVRMARSDGVVTTTEQADLETVAELLGVGLESHVGIVGKRAPEPRPDWLEVLTLAPSGGPRSALSGKSVCFTGESVCTVKGQLLSRDDQERLAVWAGLTVKSGVSHLLDVLVLADPESQSGKARKAEELGVRRIAEPAFWRHVGVPID